jgi:hypothetical protein
MGFSELILQYESEWIMTELEDTQTLQKNADANMDFSLSESNKGICVDSICERPYLRIMLKNNHPVSLTESSKQTISGSLINE